MLRTLTAGLLGLVLALPTTPLSAQSIPRPTGDVTMGRAAGAWDLPGDRDAGWMRGVLADSSGRRFAIEAKLLPVPMRGDASGGRMVGVIRALDRAGNLGRPLADVLGSYLAGPDGLGRFEATFTTSAPLVQRVGRIEGRFADPAVDGKESVGRFAGVWALR